MLLTRAQLLRTPRAFLSTAFQDVGPQHVLLRGLIPLQVQQLAFPSVEPREVLLSSIVQPVQIPLNGSTPIFGYHWWPCGRVQGDSSQQAFDGVLDPNFHALNVPRQQDRLADVGLCPLQKGVTCYWHSLIPPALLHGSISMDALMDRVPNPSYLTLGIDPLL